MLCALGRHPDIATASRTSRGRSDEIAEGIYRLSTWVPDVAPPPGFTFNQFLVDADEPLLFHAGHRQTFPLLAEAVPGSGRSRTCAG
jgi:hypothetical protein